MFFVLSSKGDYTPVHPRELFTSHSSPITIEIIPQKKNHCLSGCKSLIKHEELVSTSFQIGKRIGFGSSGEVMEVNHIRTNTILAIKIIKCTDAAMRQKIVEKYRHLKNLPSHSFMVPYYGTFAYGDNDIAVLMPIFDGSLDSLIVQKFSLEQTINIFHSISSALHDLHSLSPPIIHRDLKPQNIFKYKNGYYLGDVETAKSVAPGRNYASGGTGTFAFLAPEQISDEPESTCKTDIWGLGCSMFWITSGTKSPISMHTKIHHPNFPFCMEGNIQESPLCKLIISMLQPLPQDRPSALECLKQVEIIAKEKKITLHTSKTIRHCMDVPQSLLANMLP